MANRAGALRRVVGIGLGWGGLWTLSWIVVGSIIGIVDPDSIDPGESPFVMGPVVFGPMGFLAGIAFALLLSIPKPNWSSADVSLVRAAVCGTLGSAIAQLPNLGHGDQGLAASTKMAALFGRVFALRQT